MTAAGPNDLARALRAFFADHLPRVRGTSPHTIRSYRDSLVLLLRFVATQTRRSVIRLDLGDLGPQPVLAFLQYLELDRHNSVATRNVRLAAIHAFFRYCALEYPARLAHCQRVLAVPFKRTGSRLVEYLEHEEIEAILGVVDRRAARTAQHAAVPQAPGVAALAVRAARPAGARRPTDGPRRRVLPSRPARRQPRPLAGQGASHHRGRAYAREAPPDGRMDTRPPATAAAASAVPCEHCSGGLASGRQPVISHARMISVTDSP